jgi:hypothetical protein
MAKEKRNGKEVRKTLFVEPKTLFGIPLPEALRGQEDSDGECLGKSKGESHLLHRS